MTNSADDRILEFLSEIRDDTEVGKSPSEIGDHIGYGRKHVGRRCRELAEHGLLINLGRGSYRITDLGERYLSGDTEPDELDSDDG
jgi:predicted transcriptional regulator